MFDLFGSEMPLPAKFFIAFATVLALIGLTAWLVRRFGANRLGGASARGRQPRLAVIDAATVDGRRRLVLIRRDNVEHLLMIGGPTDVVVEPNIVRAAGAREVVREAPRAEPARVEPGLRQPAMSDNAWPLQPVNDTPPPQAPAPRSYRAAATEEPWLPPEPGARARPTDSSSLTGLAAELSTRLAPPEVAAPAIRSEPPQRAQPPAPVMNAELASQQGDQNLADMAHQLEAALRRTPMPEGRPPVSDPLAAQVAHPPARSPERAPARDMKSRVEPRFDSKFEAEPNAEPRLEPRFDARQEHRQEHRPEHRPEQRHEPAVAAAKSAYDSLEEEMASLLGRPPGKS